MRVEDIPVFSITPKMLTQLKRIDELLLSCKEISNKKADVRLRKTSRVRSINSSLSIEGNELGLLKVRDIINGKTVEGPFDEILEVQNAIRAYDEAVFVYPWYVDQFLEIQDVMMGGLVESTGFRTHKVGIYENDRLIYLEPPCEDVRPMIDMLFDWCESCGYPSPMVAAVAHYYIESIHPFSDGNGRMGRLWQHVILHQTDKTFDLVPIESYISKHQTEYYEVLERCQRQDTQDCTEFIEFCLELNIESLSDLTHLKDPRMSRLLAAMGDTPMSSSQIMRKMGMTSKPYFLKNYMHPAIEHGFVSMTQPDKPLSSKQMYRKNLL